MSKIVEKYLADNEEVEITKHEGNFSSLVWGTSCLLIYSSLMKKYLKGDFGSLALLLEGKRGIGFFNFGKYKESTTQSIDKYLYRREEFTEVEDFEKMTKEVRKIYLENSPDKIKLKGVEEIENLFLKISELTRDWQVITLFSEALDEEILKNYFEKLDINIPFEEFFGKSSLVDFESLIYSRDKALLNFDRKNPYSSQWIFGSYLTTPPIENSQKLYQDLITELGGKERIQEEQEEIERETKKNKIEVQKYLESLTSPAKDLFEFTKIAMKVRDVRKEESLKLITLLANLSRELFIRNNLDPEKNIYTIYNDYKTKIYASPSFKEELEKREKGFIIYFGKDGPEIDYVNFDETKSKIYEKMFGDTSSSEIKGSIANKGNVNGKVKVILSKKDFSKFEEGDILVTSMTRPEFVPLMKKAAGFITDEGGITCHAAIVSREMNKPCIIGTKNATAILKDNELVNLNADEGTVKILEDQKT